MTGKTFAAAFLYVGFEILCDNLGRILAYECRYRRKYLEGHSIL